MGGPGVECTSAGWSAPNPSPIRPRDPVAHKRQGLLLCAEQAEIERTRVSSARAMSGMLGDADEPVIVGATRFHGQI
jgi:hypothetical protein